MDNTMKIKRTYKHRRRAASSVMALFFVALFSSLAVSFNAMSNLNVQTARNHQEITAAQAAAESGLEFARHLINIYHPPSEAYTAYNTVSDEQAQATLGYLAAHVSNVLNGVSVTHSVATNVITAPAAVSSLSPTTATSVSI